MAVPLSKYAKMKVATIDNRDASTPSIPTALELQQQSITQTRSTLRHNNNGSTSSIQLQEDESSSFSMALWQNKSSVDYFGCCGAGHRLSRTANAYWVAKHVFHFGLRVYWRFCGSVEVFSYLFHPLHPVTELEHVTSWNQNVYFHNEITGFGPLTRRRQLQRNDTRNKRSCPCQMDKIQSDAEFYTNLRDRYRFKDHIDQFMKQHEFDKAFLRIGLHIRAGNNETGDFALKRRGIEHLEDWAHHVAQHVRSLVDNHHGLLDHEKTPSNNNTTAAANVVVYLATDTPSMLSRFRSLLMTTTTSTLYSINVIEYPQRRLDEGNGVVFGASEIGDVDNNGNDCLQSWQSIFADLFLLSHVDILVAPRSSSFTQTLPMSLVFAQRLQRLAQQQQQQSFTKGKKNISGKDNITQNQTLPPAFCEMNRNASNMFCYDTFLQWCCESQSDEIGAHFPVLPTSKAKLMIMTKWVPRPRQENCLPSPNSRGRPGYCLPFRWPKDMQEQRPIRRHRRRPKTTSS